MIIFMLVSSELSVHSQGVSGDSWQQGSLYKISPDKSLNHFDQVVEPMSQIEYHPKENRFYLNSPGTNKILMIEANNLQLSKTIIVDKLVDSLHYSQFNRLVYFTKEDQVSVLSDGQILPENLAINPASDLLVTDPDDGALYAMGLQSSNIDWFTYNLESGQIIADKKLAERTKEFQNKPVIVSTVRIFISNRDQLDTIRLVKRPSTGTISSRIVSLVNSQSPQNTPNIIDLQQMKDATIDGQNAWEFSLQAKHSITFLVAYRQFDSYYLLPKTG